MQYLFHKEAGASLLTLEGENHRYIFKVRRHKVEERLYLRNLEDKHLYEYAIEKIDKHSTLLTLQSSKVSEIKAKHSLHIGWCLIDPKSIEKVLPSLNEIGVEKITFIYCTRSQKHFKPDFTRLHTILRNSSQQSGRSTLMQLEIVESLELFLTHYPDSTLLHFSTQTYTPNTRLSTVVVGCEGGFTPQEVAYFQEENILGLDTPLILKSESAVTAISAKVLV